MVEDSQLRRLKEVVAAYGAAPERWPAGERDGLRAFAAVHRGAPWMAEARELDTLLDAVPAAAMGEGFAARVIAAARGVERAQPGRVVLMDPRNGGGNSALWNTGGAALLAASLFGGLWFGSTSSLDALVNEEPLGLAELAPGEAVDGSLATLWWDTFDGEEGFL